MHNTKKNKHLIHKIQRCVVVMVGVTIITAEPVFAVESSWQYFGEAANEFTSTFRNVSSPIDLPANDHINAGDINVKDIYNEDTQINRVIKDNYIVYCRTENNIFNIKGTDYTIDIPHGEDAFQWINGSAGNSDNLTFVGWKDNSTNNQVSFLNHYSTVESNKHFYACYKSEYNATFSNTPADNSSNLVTPNSITVTEYYNGVNKWYNNSNSQSAPQIIIPSFSGETPVKDGIDAIGFEDSVGNIYPFGSTYIFTNDNNVDFTLYYGKKYTVHLYVNPADVDGEITEPEDIWIIEYTDENSRKQYIDSYGNQSTTLQIELPQLDMVNKDGMPVAGWNTESGTQYSCGQNFVPTEQETTLTVRWEEPYQTFANTVTTKSGIGTVVAFTPVTIRDPSGHSQVFTPSGAVGTQSQITVHDKNGNEKIANIKITGRDAFYCYTITNLPANTSVTCNTTDGWSIWYKNFYTTDYIPDVYCYFNKSWATCSGGGNVPACSFSLNMNNFSNPGLTKIECSCGAPGGSSSVISPASVITGTSQYYKEAELNGQNWKTTTFSMAAPSFYTRSGSSNAIRVYVFEDYFGIRGEGW